MQPLDRTALGVIVGLCILIGGLLWGGDQTYPRVRDFSWQNQQVGIEDRAFILTFNRPMNWQTVVDHLRVSPPLAGKLSWSGRRLAYTLTEPMPYGQTFTVTLANAEGATRSQRPMAAFTGQFKSCDRRLVYLGIAGAENGRLVLENFTQNTQEILTPPDLNVLDFRVNPGQDRVIFTAVDRNQPTFSRYEASLYAVGLSQDNLQVQRLLDNSSHQILDFDVNPNGDQIIVQRFGLGETGEIRLWRLTADQTLTEIDYATDGSTFRLAPDGQTLAVSLSQGVAILSLLPQHNAAEPEFLPKFTTTLGFARNGSAALMSRQNPDQTQSLVWVPNQGQRQELLKTTGYIFDAQVDSTLKRVYCLYSKFNPDADFRADLYLSAIDLTSKQQRQLASFPNQMSGHFSLTPDDSAIVYEEITVTDQPHPSVVRNLLGQTVTSATLWRLPLNPSPLSSDTALPSPEKLGTGIMPRWIP